MCLSVIDIAEHYPDTLATNRSRMNHKFILLKDKDNRAQTTK